MSKYINAEQLEKAGWVMNRTTRESPTSITYETRKPTDFPTDLDVQEVKHGRWYKGRVSSTGGGSYGVYQCSICEAMFPDVGYGYNYCPNCGSRMDIKSSQGKLFDEVKRIKDGIKEMVE